MTKILLLLATIWLPIAFGGQGSSPDLNNGSFEGGLDGWTVAGDKSETFNVVPGSPDGLWVLEVGRRSGVTYLSQPVSVGEGCTLSFWWRMRNDSPYVHDKAAIGYLDGGTWTPLWTVRNDGPSTNWARVGIALPPGAHELAVLSDVMSWRLWMVLFYFDGLEVSCP